MENVSPSANPKRMSVMEPDCALYRRSGKSEELALQMDPLTRKRIDIASNLEPLLQRGSFVEEHMKASAAVDSITLDLLHQSADVGADARVPIKDGLEGDAAHRRWLLAQLLCQRLSNAGRQCINALAGDAVTAVERVHLCIRLVVLLLIRLDRSFLLENAAKVQCLTNIPSLGNKREDVYDEPTCKSALISLHIESCSCSLRS